jgi:membrane protease YdiL (CAAX protease family)
VYLAWGLFQEYLLNGYFVNRFVQFTTHAPAVAAITFAAAHAPNWFLMLATGMGGYFAAIAYLRYRNLFVLGLAHGILGFLIYFAIPDSVTRHLYVGPKWFRA